MTQAKTILGLDLGQARIGVARGNTLARLATPLAVIQVDGKEAEALAKIIEQERAEALVVGLPRGLDGQDTAQTAWTRDFARGFEGLGLPLLWQDEAGTSVQAEQQGQNDRLAADARAAALILQDYLDNLK